MIKYNPFSMFDAFENPNIQTVVNPINCMGIMGKGLALEFKIRYPKMFDDYQKRFKDGLLKTGEPYLFKTQNKWILNFPTKNHWRYPSRLEYIDTGLRYFSEHYKRLGIKSIAFPRLGCTSGGLKWEEVKPVMEKYLMDLKGISVYVYLDQKASEKEEKILNLLNGLDKSKIKERFKFTDKQADSIKNYIQKHGTLKRLRDLLEIKGIGPASYQKTLTSRNVPSDSQKEFLL